MDFAIFRLFIRVSLFVIALIACIIYLIKKRKLIYSIFFDKEAIKKERGESHEKIVHIQRALHRSHEMFF